MRPSKQARGSEVMISSFPGPGFDSGAPVRVHAEPARRSSCRPRDFVPDSAAGRSTFIEEAALCSVGTYVQLEYLCLEDVSKAPTPSAGPGTDFLVSLDGSVKET